MGGRDGGRTERERRASARPLRLLVVDDHALFVDGLRLVLAAELSVAELVWAPTCERALEILAAGARFDLVLFDPGLPGLSHAHAFAHLRAAAPDVPIVFVSSDDRRRAIGDALKQGARGFIHKGVSATLMVGALRLVLAGGTYVPPEAVLDPPADAPSLLTPRELQVIELVAAGLSNKEIATKLGLSESTVRVHVASIGRRLGRTSRFEIATSPVALALLQGSKPGKAR